MATTTVCQDGDATHVVVLSQSTIAQIAAVGVQGPPGPVGPAGADATGAIPPASFAFGDAPTTLYTPAAASTVASVRVRVTQSFDGLGATLALGTPTDPDKFVTAADVDLAAPVEYELTPDAPVAAGEPIILTITPGTGATSGAGSVLLVIRPT